MKEKSKEKLAWLHEAANNFSQNQERKEDLHRSNSSKQVSRIIKYGLKGVKYSIANEVLVSGFHVDTILDVDGHSLALEVG